MCAILFTTRLLKDLNKIIQFSKNRGPDKISTFTIQQFNFVHQLLSITGNVTEQPFIQNNIYLYLMVKFIILKNSGIINPMENV